LVKARCKRIWYTITPLTVVAVSEEYRAGLLNTAGVDASAVAVATAVASGTPWLTRANVMAPVRNALMDESFGANTVRFAPILFNAPTRLLGCVGAYPLSALRIAAVR